MMSGCRPPINYERECDQALFNMRVYGGTVSESRSMGYEPSRYILKKQNDALYGVVKYCPLSDSMMKSFNRLIAVSDKGLGL